MDHAPIYRADEQHPPAAGAPVRRSMSLVSAVAALTISGIALGYHGFAQPGLDAAPTAPQTQSAGIGVPVPIVALPLVNGGHPDLLAQLSTALEAPVQQVRALVQPAPVAAPPPLVSVATPTVFLPEPLPAPFVLSVDIAAPDDAAPADDSAADASAASPADDTAAPEPAPVARFAAPVRLVAPAVTDDDAEAPLVGDSADVNAASVDDAPPPAEPVVEAPAPPPVAAPVKAAAPAPAPVARQSAPPPPPPGPPPPAPAAQEPAPARVAIVREDPKPQPRQEDAPKPQEAKKDPGPPPPQAQNANRGDGGHADAPSGKNNAGNAGNGGDGGNKGDNGGGNKGGKGHG